jgi:hypothetical protein
MPKKGCRVNQDHVVKNFVWLYPIVKEVSDRIPSCWLLADVYPLKRKHKVCKGSFTHFKSRRRMNRRRRKEEEEEEEDEEEDLPPLPDLLLYDEEVVGARSPRYLLLDQWLKGFLLQNAARSLDYDGKVLMAVRQGKFSKTLTQQLRCLRSSTNRLVTLNPKP